MGLKQFPQTNEQRLRGGWLWLARLAVLLAFLATIVSTLIGWPTVIDNIQDIRSTFPFEGWSAAELTEATSQLGLSADSIAATMLISDVIILVIYWGLAFLLFLRYSDRWFGLLVPYILVGLGVAVSIYNGAAWDMGITQLSEPLRTILVLTSTSVWPAFLISLYLFPDGKVVPRWARFLLPGPPLLFIYTFIALQATPETVILSWAEILLAGFMLGGGISQIYRYLKVSNSAERQQTKWILLALVLLIIFFMFEGVTFGTNPSQRLLTTLIFNVGLRTLIASFLPIAFAISFTRYRLWDVDELVSRALVYGFLTAFFAAVFAASTVLVNQISLTFLGEGSGALAPVASAVIVAAFFQPTRKRLEEWVDKRFYPQKKELSAGLVEADPGFWPFISLEKLLDSSLSHVAEHLHTKPLAAFLVTGDKRLRPAAALSVQVGKLGTLDLTKKQLDEFKKKRVAAIENDQLFVALVPLSIPAKSKDLVGAIALGPRATGRGYSGEDLKTLVELGGKLALAIHAIQVREEKR